MDPWDEGGAEVAAHYHEGGYASKALYTKYTLVLIFGLECVFALWRFGGAVQGGCAMNGGAPRYFCTYVYPIRIAGRHAADANEGKAKRKRCNGIEGKLYSFMSRNGMEKSWTRSSGRRGAWVFAGARMMQDQDKKASVSVRNEMLKRRVCFNCN